MRTRIVTGLLTLVLAGSPMIVGCDKEISKDETTHQNPDGTVTKNSTVVTQSPDGSITKTQDSSKTP